MRLHSIPKPRLVRLALAVIGLCGCLVGQVNTPSADPRAGVVVTLYSGSGGKELSVLGAGAVIQGGENGLVLAPYHLLGRGDRFLVFDHVTKGFTTGQLLTYDQDSDLAAIAFRGEQRPPLLTSTNVPGPQSAFNLVGPVNGELKTIAIGRLAMYAGQENDRPENVRPTFVTFTRQIGSGGVVLDAQGRLAGLIRHGELSVPGEREGENLFALTPAATLLSFAEIARGAGKAGEFLKLNAQRDSEAHQSSPKELSKVVRTIHVTSRTTFIPRDLMIEKLTHQKGFEEADLVLVDDQDRADAEFIADFIPFTFDYTYRVVDRRTRAIIVNGKVTAFNGYIAAEDMADQFQKKMAARRKEATESASGGPGGKQP